MGGARCRESAGWRAIPQGTTFRDEALELLSQLKAALLEVRRLRQRGSTDDLDAF